MSTAIPIATQREEFFRGKKAYTYDDIQIQSGYSTIESRSMCVTKTRIGGIDLDIPLIAAPMSTVCEAEMARAISRLGGLGIIHRGMSIDAQVDQVKSAMDYGVTSFRHHLDDYVRLLKNGVVSLEDFITPFQGANTQQIASNVIQEIKKHFPTPKVGAAVGARGDFIERAQELVAAGASIILIDTAHGDHEIVLRALQDLKRIFGDVIPLIAGNVATGSGAVRLAESGACAIRVGVGNGAVCETRIRTGVGTPQATAVFHCVNALQKENCDAVIIADGGIRYPGDVAKALALGSGAVMVGSLFSGTKETPGVIHKEGMWPNEKLYKRYSGEASFDKKQSQNAKTSNVEGNSKRVPYKGKLSRIVNDIMEGVRSAMSYVGADTLEDFRDTTIFMEVTTSGMREAMPHILLED